MAGTYRTYPTLTLQVAKDKLLQLYQKTGKGPSSKQAYVKGLGYKGISGASNAIFAAMIHYGFIEKAGIDYKISPLGMQLLLPTDESEDARLRVLREAALRPSLFRDVYEKYRGEHLPGLLQNSLVHDFRVYDKSGKDAAEKIRQTFEFSGLLHDGNLLDDPMSETTSIDHSHHVNMPSADASDKGKLGTGKSLSSASSPSVPMTTLTKDFGGMRIATLSIPSNLSQEERQKLVTLIENM
jgi:hypothetical protein